jgi:hypothetical protein
MDLLTLTRLGLIFVRLLLCCLALQTDLRVLRGRVGPAELMDVHRRLLWLLGGLWTSGLAVAAIDLGFDIALIGERPKLMVELFSVVVLTLNGQLLRHWCFPRLSSGRSLGTAETAVLLEIGAVSTASWLTAAFIGIARSLQGLPLAGWLSLYGAARGAAVTIALAIVFLWSRRVPAAVHCPADVSAPIQI